VPPPRVVVCDRVAPASVDVVGVAERIAVVHADIDEQPLTAAETRHVILRYVTVDSEPPSDLRRDGPRLIRCEFESVANRRPGPARSRRDLGQRRTDHAESRRLSRLFERHPSIETRVRYGELRFAAIRERQPNALIRFASFRASKELAPVNAVASTVDIMASRATRSKLHRNSVGSFALP
jgi:hypothetical protein